MENRRIRFPWRLRRIVFAVILIIGCSSAACGGMNQTPAGSGNTSMKPSLPIDAKLILDETNHTIIFLKGRNLSAALESDAHFRQIQAKNETAAIAKAFIEAYCEEFRLIDPVAELAAASVITDDLGLTHIRFQQIYREIPVSASEIIVHLDRDKHVYLVNGRYIPTPDHLNIQPHITVSDAEAVVAKHLERDRADCPGCATNLIIFPKPGNGALLAFRVEALIRADEGWIYFIDAHSGLIIERQTTIRSSP